LQSIKHEGKVWRMNSTMNNENASKVINAAVETYASMRGITKAEVLAAYEVSETVRNSIFLLVCGGLALAK
jgi:hypothetical protein